MCKSTEVRRVLSNLRTERAGGTQAGGDRKGLTKVEGSQQEVKLCVYKKFEEEDLA